MPTYDYQCDACDHSFEHFQNISSDALKKCPECGKKKLRRLFGTGAAIVFKGSGFYETDYRSDSYKKGADAAKKAAEPPKSDSKNDSKSAATDKGSSETKSSKKQSSSKKADS